MSSANLVPETWELDSDDAAETLRRARFPALLVDSVKRFRAADGFSHSRSLAFVMMLTFLPGIIAVAGLATVVGIDSFSDAVHDVVNDIAPGASGAFLTDALEQARSAGTDDGVAPLVFGLFAMFVSGVTLFGQIERGSNRIYGIEQDRPFRDKYGLALRLFAVSVVLVTGVLLAFGFFHEAHLFGPSWLRATLRSVVASAVAAVCFARIFQRSPRRRQPEMSWLLVGSSIATVLWLVATVGLALFWRAGDTFGQTYGPLAGVMAFALWCYVISIGLFLGLAFAAQLEAVRAGRSAPQDARKVRQSEPGTVVTSPGPVDLGLDSPARS